MFFLKHRSESAEESEIRNVERKGGEGEERKRRDKRKEGRVSKRGRVRVANQRNSLPTTAAAAAATTTTEMAVTDLTLLETVHRVHILIVAAITKRRK